MNRRLIILLCVDVEAFAYKGSSARGISSSTSPLPARQILADDGAAAAAGYSSSSAAKTDNQDVKSENVDEIIAAISKDPDYKDLAAGIDSKEEEEVSQNQIDKVCWDFQERIYGGRSVRIEQYIL